MAAIPNPPAPAPTSSNVGRIGRAFAGIASFLGRGAATWTADELEARWSGLKGLLVLSVLIPLASFFIGMIIGRIGIALDSDGCITVADWIIAVGGFVGGLLVTFLWTKLMVYGMVIGHGSHGLNRLVSAVPTLDVAAIDRFLTWARGWTAWYMGAMLYVILVPCYRNLTVSAVAMLSLLALAGILSARWFDGPWARRILLASVLGTFVFATATMFIPGLTRSLRLWSDGYFAEAKVMTDRATGLDTVSRTAEEARTKTLTGLSKRFSGRRTELENSMLDCGGHFCSDADRLEYNQLGEKIGQIRDGTFIQHESGAAKRASAPQPRSPALNPSVASDSEAPSSQLPASSSSSRLAPPPILSGGGAVAISRPSDDSLVPSQPHTPAPSDSDYGYGNLDTVLARHRL